MTIWEIILSTLIFLSPAYLANMFASIVPKFTKEINKPISTKHLGSHKTWAGLIGGTTIGSILGSIIYFFAPPTPNFIALAITGAFGALLGDAIKSFAKRHLQIKPGQPFVPFDQIDLVIGSLVLQSFIIPMPNFIVLTGLLITPPLHLLANITAYKLKLKKVWW